METFSFSMLLFSLQAWVKVDPFAVSAVIVPFSSPTLPVQAWTAIAIKSGNHGATQSLNQPVVCPGGTECPEFATCCSMPSGDYGCCPFPDAVCCSDQAHCCPKNTKCDLAESRCATQASNLDVFIPMGKKFVWPKTLKVQGHVKTITCGDQQSECPDGTTCCQLQSGDWGCCPFDKAVCCSDKAHCCPKDTVCNLEEQRCQKSTGRFSKVTALQPVFLYGNRTAHHLDTDCPDAKHCEDDFTCCKMKSGSYGCCPFAKADCCSDGLHCCPEGQKCNVKEQKCQSV